MKRFLTIITIAAILGLIGFYFYEKNGGIHEIQIKKLEQLRFTSVKAFPQLSLSASANAVLENKNSFGVHVTGLDFDVFVDEKHTTKVKQDLSQVIPGASEYDFPINFEIPLGKAGFFKDAKEVISGAWKNKSLKIRTSGIITIRAIDLEFDLPFDEENEYLIKDYLK